MRGPLLKEATFLKNDVFATFFLKGIAHAEACLAASNDDGVDVPCLLIIVSHFLRLQLA